MKHSMFSKKFLSIMLSMLMVGMIIPQYSVDARAVACPPHGDYYDKQVAGKDINYEHSTRKPVYAYNEYGYLVDISAMLAHPEYVICKVHYSIPYYGVFCGKCNVNIGYYDGAATPEKHSVCRIGVG